MAVEKAERIMLVARISPDDHARFTGRAHSESRSYDETLAVLLRESELLRALQAQREPEAACR